MGLTIPTVTKESSEGDHKEVVRLTTSCWCDNRGFHVKRSLLPMKRKSAGIRMLDEDSSMIGADEVLSHIVNLDECRDGMYLVTTCNEQRDWESGYIEAYDYKLVAFSES